MKTPRTTLFDRLAQRLAAQDLKYPRVAAATISCRGIADIETISADRDFEPAQSRSEFAQLCAITEQRLASIEAGEIAYSDVDMGVVAMWANHDLNPRKHRQTFSTMNETTAYWERLGCPGCGARHGLFRFELHTHRIGYKIADGEATETSSEFTDDSFYGDESFYCPHCDITDDSPYASY